MSRIAVLTALTFLVFSAGAMVANARPVYARNENKPCGFCHVRPTGGGARGFRGQFYGANGLSLENFDEKREALIAGLTPGSEGVNSVPATSYNGNVSGPAAQQIQVASLRGPVLLLFLDKPDANAKAAVKTFAAIAKAYGNRATMLGVARTEDAITLTEELGSLIRVYADPDGGAIKKFSASQALDVAAVAKLGDPIRTLPGFSRANLESAMKAIEVPMPAIDLKLVPEKPVRGAKLQPDSR